MHALAFAVEVIGHRLYVTLRYVHVLEGRVEFASISFRQRHKLEEAGECVGAL